jgi:hypothetical protein
MQVTRAHGATGTVRAKFQKNLPPKALVCAGHYTRCTLDDVAWRFAMQLGHLTACYTRTAGAHVLYVHITTSIMPWEFDMYNVCRVDAFALCSIQAGYSSTSHW